jgi:RNA polymerase sigma-70 factor, ECF subfamily
MPFRSGARSPQGVDGVSTSRWLKAESRPPLPSVLHGPFSACLERVYAPSLCATLPPHLLALASRLETASDTAQARDPDRFRDDLLRLLPHLRRFARAITRGAGQTDDLVQETLLRAWQSKDHYRPGSNLKAWAFMIMRNSFYARVRTARPEVSDRDGAAARRCAKPADQTDEAPSREASKTSDRSKTSGRQDGTVKRRVSPARRGLPGTLGAPRSSHS